jgi:hypothetical protein
MSWESILKDKTELKRKNIEHAKNLFNSRDRQWFKNKFGGEDNAKYDGISRLVRELQLPRTFNDDKKFFEIFDKITHVLG